MQHLLKKCCFCIALYAGISGCVPVESWQSSQGATDAQQLAADRGACQNRASDLAQRTLDTAFPATRLGDMRAGQPDLSDSDDGDDTETFASCMRSRGYIKTQQPINKSN